MRPSRVLLASCCWIIGCTATQPAPAPTPTAKTPQPAAAAPSASSVPPAPARKPEPAPDPYAAAKAALDAVLEARRRGEPVLPRLEAALQALHVLVEARPEDRRARRWRGETSLRLFKYRRWARASADGLSESAESDLRAAAEGDPAERAHADLALAALWVFLGNSPEANVPGRPQYLQLAYARLTEGLKTAPDDLRAAYLATRAETQISQAVRVMRNPDAARQLVQSGLTDCEQALKHTDGHPAALRARAWGRFAWFILLQGWGRSNPELLDLARRDARRAAWDEAVTDVETWFRWALVADSQADAGLMHLARTRELYEESEEALTGVLQRHPGHVLALAKRANVRIDLALTHPDPRPGLAGAVEDLDRAVRIAPDEVDAWLELSSAATILAERRLRAGDDPESMHRKAIEAVFRALDVLPDHPVLHAKLATARLSYAASLRQRDGNPLRVLDESIRELRRVAGRAPNVAALHRAIGEAFRMRGEIEEDKQRARADVDTAIAALTEALKFDPDNVYTAYLRGEAWYLRGDSDERLERDATEAYRAAVADFTTGVDARPPWPGAAFRRAEARLRLAWLPNLDGAERLTRFRAALADYRHSVNTEPEYRSSAQSQVRQLESRIEELVAKAAEDKK